MGVTSDITRQAGQESTLEKCAQGCGDALLCHARKDKSVEQDITCAALNRLVKMTCAACAAENMHLDTETKALCAATARYDGQTTSQLGNRVALPHRQIANVLGCDKSMQSKTSAIP